MVDSPEYQDFLSFFSYNRTTSACSCNNIKFKNRKLSNSHWICQHRHIALFKRVFSANCNFWLRKFFHLGEIRKPPLYKDNSLCSTLKSLTKSAKIFDSWTKELLFLHLTNFTPCNVVNDYENFDVLQPLNIKSQTNKHKVIPHHQE